MNAVTMTGTLTKDPEMKEGGETKVCRMRVAELNGGDSQLFVNVAAFGRQAEVCGEHLAKGRHVAVVGRLKLRQWENEDGEKRSEHSIAADRVDFLPGGNGKGKAKSKRRRSEEEDDDE